MVQASLVQGCVLVDVADLHLRARCHACSNKSLACDACPWSCTYDRRLVRARYGSRSRQVSSSVVKKSRKTFEKKVLWERKGFHMVGRRVISLSFLRILFISPSFGVPMGYDISTLVCGAGRHFLRGAGSRRCFVLSRCCCHHGQYSRFFDCIVGRKDVMLSLVESFHSFVGPPAGDRFCRLFRHYGAVMCGLNSTWWSEKHNLHHAFTNVVGVDEDIMVRTEALREW